MQVNQEGFTEVYTDGACPNNGKGGARAGVGVWWGAVAGVEIKTRPQSNLVTRYEVW